MSKEEYDSCSITSSNPRIIAVCDKPHQAMYFTITFRSFTPQPGGLEFKPGQDYYFITTSTGRPDGLHRRFGGRCASRHMKVTFKVCCKDGHGQSDNSDSIVTSTNTTSTALKSTPGSSSADVQPFTVVTSSTIPSVNGHNLNGHNPSSSTVRPVMKPDIHSLLRVARPTQSPVSDEAPSTQKIHSFLSSTIPSASSSTPFWWRPNYVNTKLPPTVRQGSDAMASGGSSSDSESSGTNGGQSNGKKGRAWLLVVAAGIAVGVACLIVCGLGIGRRLFIIDKSKDGTMVTTHHHHHGTGHHHSLHHTLPYPHHHPFSSPSPSMTPPSRHIYGEIG